MRSTLISISPSYWKRCINSLLRGRVVPTIVDNSSWVIRCSMRMLRGSCFQSLRQVQERLAQPLFAVQRHQIGDGLLLVSDAHRQLAHKACQQCGAADYLLLLEVRSRRYY
jgi:hypothetical protein